MEDGTTRTTLEPLPSRVWIRYYLWELLIRIPVGYVPPLYFSVPVFWNGANDKTASCVRATLWLEINVFFYASGLFTVIMIICVLLYLCCGGKREDLLGPKLAACSESCVQCLTDRLGETHMFRIVCCTMTFMQVQEVALAVVWLIWQLFGLLCYNTMNHTNRCRYIGERIELNLYYLVIRFLILEPVMYLLTRCCLFRDAYAHLKIEKKLAERKKMKEWAKIRRDEKDDKCQQLAGGTDLEADGTRRHEKHKSKSKR